MIAEAIPFPEDFSRNVIDLGMQKRYFRVKKRNRIVNLIFFFLLLAGSIPAFLGGLVSNTYDGFFGLIGLAIILFAIGLGAGWSAYSNWDKAVGLYERGFAYHDRKGYQVWHWTDIQSIQTRITRHYYNGVYTGTTHEYTLLNKQNEKIKLNDVFQKVEELADAIEQNIYPDLYSAAADAFNNGRMLTFGPVCVDKAGLHMGKKDLLWKDIQQISLANGFLQVVPQGGGLFKNASVSAAAIPNLRILLSIINQVVGLKT